MCHVEVSMDIRSWRTIKDVQALLRELDIRKVITDAQLTALDRPDSRKTRFSKDLKTCMSISQHTSVRQGLYKVGKDLTVIQNSACTVSIKCQSKLEDIRERQSWQCVLSGLFEGQCVKLCFKKEFLRGWEKWTESQIIC